MRTRHRTPTLFSIYMVDVLCCALGCVILLWLIDSREAYERKKEAGETSNRLGQTSRLLTDASTKLNDTKNRLDEMGAQFRSAAGERDKFKADALKLQMELAALLDKNKDLLATIQLKDQDYQKLAQQNKLSTEQLVKLQKLLDDKNLQFKNLNEKYLTSEDVVKLLKNQLQDADQKSENLMTQLKTFGQDNQQMAGKLTAAELEIAKLQNQARDADKLIKKLEKLVAQFEKETENYKDMLNVSENQAADLVKELSKKEQEATKKKTELATLLQKLEDLAKLNDVLQKKLNVSKEDLDQAKVNLSSLEKDKLQLLKQAVQLKEEMASRFAGIELTGKRVVFLVDVSGSMGMLNSKQADPKKWPMVCDLISKLMRSLPDVTHFQVITFSDRTGYPLGHKGKWLLWDADHTANFVEAQLKKIKPQGATSMYPAFQEAFFYKAGDLDTIYLISDGLPDPPEQDYPAHIKNLTRPEQTAFFCNQVRQQLKTSWNASVRGKIPVRINTIGFFFESPELGAFLWALARENDGNFVGMSRP